MAVFALPCVFSDGTCVASVRTIERFLLALDRTDCGFGFGDAGVDAVALVLVSVPLAVGVREPSERVSAYRTVQATPTLFLSGATEQS